MPQDVAQLVTAARDGDREAFDELVRATHAETFTLALRLTGNEEDARDVVQEAYIRAFKGIGRFRGDAQFSTWMYRITANCANTLLAKRTKHRHDVLDDAVTFLERLVTVLRPATGVGGRGVGRDAVHPRRELRVAAEALQALPGPEVRVLHHVPCILLVTGEPERERERLCVRRANQLVESRSVPVASGGDQVGHVLWHRAFDPPSGNAVT